MRNTRKGLLVVTLMIGSVFAQYTKGNSVIAWSKYKWEDLSKVEGASGKDWTESAENYFNSRNKVDRLLKSSLMLTHY